VHPPDAAHLRPDPDQPVRGDDEAAPAAPQARSRHTPQTAHLTPWQWTHGQSGNPRGSPPSALRLAGLARASTNNGHELVAFFVSVMRGEPIVRPGHAPQLPRLEVRVQAAEWLADRGFGRARELVEVIGDAASRADKERANVRALARLSDEDRATLRAILTRAFGAPPEAALEEESTGRPGG
jgi:hypothetical protein